MSMQRVVNYGSFLQAYALKRLIEKVGNTEVEFVDYEYERSLVKRDIERRSIVGRILLNRNIPYYIKKKMYLKKRDQLHLKNLEGIGITNQHNTNSDLDVLVIGSDEVFNCMQPYPVGYSRGLFGKGYFDANVISYAASFGHTKLNQLIECGIKDEIADLLGHFSAISVRDVNSSSIVSELTGKTPALHLDPVLIYDFSNERTSIKKIEQKYIILYAYTDRLTKEEERYIKAFSKKMKMKIISIGNYQRIADENIACHPFDVFPYFENASFIITDTFHGTIFSIKTHAHFCTILRDSNRNKLHYLLSKLQCADREVSELSDIDKLFLIKKNYVETEKILNSERQKTMNFLKEFCR